MTPPSCSQFLSRLTEEKISIYTSTRFKVDFEDLHRQRGRCRLALLVQIFIYYFSRRLAGLIVFQGIPPGSDFVDRISVSRVAGLVVFWSCRIGGYLVLVD